LDIRDKLLSSASNGLPFQVEEELGKGPGADEGWLEWGCRLSNFYTEFQWATANKRRKEWRGAESHARK
jgi:hypothetical protein